jgi:hypothetical protein
MELNRRGFLIGAGAVLAAPAIVRAASLMPVRNRLIVPQSVTGDVRWEWRAGYPFPSVYDGEKWIQIHTNTHWDVARNLIKPSSPQT